MIVACLITITVSAQKDSSVYDAGYLTLKKEFTQAITIRGADLEKMPFANLSEAIEAWSYGAYTQPGTLLYVVDGNPVGDVNAYPVYDIEEVVLVQNATALAGTGGGQQELVLITTKRGKGKQGVRASAHTGFVNGNGGGSSTGTALYHQYYLGAYRNTDKWSYGVSGNYLRDVWPLPEGGGKTVSSTYDVQRWRLNGYASWRPWKGNQIDVLVNYTPEKLASANDSTNGSAGNDFAYKGSGKLRYLVPQVRWHSDLGSGWRNELQATYLNSKYTENDQLRANFAPDSTGLALYNGLAKSYHLLIRDHIGYEGIAGSWRIAPALNASYEHFNDQVTDATSNVMNPIPGTIFGGTYSISTQAYALKANAIFLTPAIDLQYKKILDLQGGVVVNASSLKGDSVKRRVLPFVSAAVDVFRLADVIGSGSLKVFGSYAQRTNFSPASYTIPDLGNGLNLGLNYTDPFGSFTALPPGTVVGTVPTIPVAVPPAYWVWMSGVGYSGMGGRLELNYTFERRNYITDGYKYYPVSGLPFVPFGATLPQWRSDLHHFDVQAVVVKNAGLEWRSGLNVTLLRSNVDTTGSDVILKPAAGDIAPGTYSWTGGWVNRLRINRFTAGLDLLYHFGAQAGVVTSRNTAAIPNVYAGYRFGGVEVFVESRGLIRSTYSDLEDQRRYYTAGVTFSY
jgi:hypothetical protein